MLFAALDYRRYRRREGRYSPERLRQEGFRIADQSWFRTFSTAKPGSFLFVHTYPSFLSWVVMYYTVSNISHTCLFRGPGVVLDLLTSGVTVHPASDYLDSQSFICLFEIKDNASEAEARAAMEETVHKYEGLPYGWHKAFRIGILALIGRNRRFRWSFVLDSAVVFIPLGILAALLGRSRTALVLLAIAALHAGVAFKNRAIRRLRERQTLHN